MAYVYLQNDEQCNTDVGNLKVAVYKGTMGGFSIIGKEFLNTMMVERACKQTSTLYV